MADHQLRRRTRRPLVVGHARHEFLDHRESTRTLVHHVLRVEEPDATAIDIAGTREQLFHLIVLATKSEHEHAARVRIAHESREHGLRVREVVTPS